ncbi:MAG: hypothetical protein JSU96_01105 [Acidobacteriota bacterium]|nr:MAG: hypothetical protein JSU96_01105 [Acidobacteriota bacterium]
MSVRFSTGSSRRLAFLFLGVVVPPAVTLVWLGLQLLDQDRALLAQRELERRESAAAQIVRSLELSIAELVQTPAESLREGLVRLSVSSVGILATPPDRIFWYPVSNALEEADPQPFVEYELLEFQEDRGRALRAYRQLAGSSDEGIRAGALLRVARVERRTGQGDKALKAYHQLAEIDQIAFNGMPADLLARRSICALLEEAGRQEELLGEASDLQGALLSGKWILDRPAWELTVRQLEQWTGSPLPDGEEERLFSAVAAWLWDLEKQGREQDIRSIPRQTTFGEVTLLRNLSTVGTEVTVIAPRALQLLVAGALGAENGESQRLSLLTPSGELLAGAQPLPGSSAVRRLASETGLPWTLVLSSRHNAPVLEEFAGRRRLLMLGLASIVLLLAGGSYLLWRVIRQELEIARLQTEFVSAVSHEFRTPLASLRHVTELMQEDDNVPPERRRAFYDSLARNTERLHRLVESLLDFARMEGKKKPFNFRPIDVGELVASTVADFRREAESRGLEISLFLDSKGQCVSESGQEGRNSVLGDPDALSSALWNLFDNAVKYSPGRARVQVSVQRNAQDVTVAIQDEGLGIPVAEQKAVFRRFGRGQKAGELGIKGTGLGLAMVSHIVQAHHGKVELESIEGKGSTFRMVLPMSTGGEGDQAK